MPFTASGPVPQPPTHKGSDINSLSRWNGGFCKSHKENFEPKTTYFLFIIVPKSFTKCPAPSNILLANHYVGFVRKDVIGWQDRRSETLCLRLNRAQRVSLVQRDWLVSPSVNGESLGGNADWMFSPSVKFTYVQHSAVYSYWACAEWKRGGSRTESFIYFFVFSGGE